MSSRNRAEAAPTVDLRAFPPAFLWGAATSAYQVEGAVEAGGRGPSMWDTFSHTPGRTRDGDTGDVSADHYHRWPEDVALLAEHGLNAYRFSIAWPRIQPDGRGPANPRGLDFYGRLVDGLLERGITPVATLYHWDLPQTLGDAGGWRARDTAGRFADYAALVAGALGDRVERWSTINEPWCVAFLGHAAGVHAPGLTDPAAGVRAAHHVLLAHGLATEALRSAGARRVSITLNLYPVTAASDRAADVAAARLIDGLHNRLFLEPVLAGRYPDDLLAHLGPIGGLEAIEDDDLARIGAGIDELGVNYYTRHIVRAAERGAAAAPSPYPGARHVEFVHGPGERTAMGWAVDPDGLAEVLVRVRHDYGDVPMLVHENGAAFDDAPTAGGYVHDEARVRYLAAHLRAAGRAIDGGVDLRGYFVWSLLDNFEWGQGYSKRFGLVHVDFETQARTPRDSARWLRDRIAEHRSIV
jgi:beta-glucosidase